MHMPHGTSPQVMESATRGNESGKLVVFLYATKFQCLPPPDDDRLVISRCLAEALPSGATVITINKRLGPGDGFEVLTHTCLHDAYLLLLLGALAGDWSMCLRCVLLVLCRLCVDSWQHLSMQFSAPSAGQRSRCICCADS